MRQEIEVDESAFFREATLRIYSSLNIDVALRRCMDYMKGYIPILGMVLGRSEPDSNIGRILAYIMPPHFKRPSITIKVPLELKERLKTFYERSSTITIINNIDQADPLHQAMMPLFLPDSEKSILQMDLVLEGTRVGDLLLFAQGKNRYKESHARLMSLLNEPFAEAISKILQHQEILQLRDKLAVENLILKSKLREATVGSKIIGANGGLKVLMETVRHIAPTNSPVILIGETGVGKEIIANAIHYGSNRRNGPFIKVNCGAIPESLIDSELFGHEKGAFTGAVTKKLGRFERAHTGTIFLDEIGELPQAAQVRLLRVLQQYEIERVGGAETVPVDVRVISATHRNLEELTKAGHFREDLWFRLNVFPIMIPPLRQRTQDIPELVRYIIERKSNEFNIIPPAFSTEDLENLQKYDWPGNVRELENYIERALIQNQIDGHQKILHFELDKMHTPVLKSRIHPERSNTNQTLDQWITYHIQETLMKTHGKVAGKDGAAAILGLNPNTLRGKMRKLKISYAMKTKI